MNQLIDLPDDGAQLRIATRYQLRFFRRSNRVLASALLMAIITTITLGVNFYNGAATVQAQYHDSGSYMASGFGFFPFILVVAVVAAMLGGDAIATDFGSATGYYALVLPVRRSVLLLGRYLAAALIGVGVTLIYFLAIMGAAQYFFGSLPVDATLGALGLTVLVVLAFVGFAFLLSSMFRRPTISTIVVLLLLILAFPLVTSLLTSFGIEPWFMINYGAAAIAQVLAPQAHSGSIPTDIGRNMTVLTHFFNPYVWQGVLILVGYLVLSLGASIAIYDRKELKG